MGSISSEKVRTSVSVTHRAMGKTGDSLYSDGVTFGYTCFLIPKIPSHKLTEKHARVSSAGLKQLCLSNGWKLEFVKVNAKYLQWAISVAYPVTVANMISQVRSDLNNQFQFVFKKQKLTPSPEFWAEGYLLLHGVHLQAQQLINRYILLIRQQQKQR